MTDNMIEAGEAILSSENNYVTYFQLKNSQWLCRLPEFLLKNNSLNLC